METHARQIELYNEAMNGTGATMAANEIYADSLEGKLNTLSIEWSSLAQSVMSENVFKSAVDGITGLVKVLNTLSPIITMIASVAIPALVAAFTLGLIAKMQTAITTMSIASGSLKQLILDFTGLSLVAKTGGTGLLGLTWGFTGVTTGANTATVAVTAFKLAVSTISVVFAILPIVITLFSSISRAIKKTQVTTDELIESVGNLNNKFKENADAIKQSEENLKLIAQLQELVNKGMGDPLNNLNKEEIEDYKAIVDELEQLYPQLTSSWTSYANINKEDLDLLIEKEKTLYQAKLDTQKLEMETGLTDMQKAQATKEQLMQDIKNAEDREKELEQKKIDLEKQIEEKRANGEKTSIGGGYSDQSMGYMYSQSLDEQLKSTTMALEMNKQKLIENQNEVLKLDEQTEIFLTTIDTLKESGIDIDIDTDQFRNLSKLVKEVGTEFGRVKDDAEDFAKATAANMDAYVEGRLQELPKLIGDAANAFTDAANNMQGVVDAQGELAENGELSLSTITSLAEKYPEIIGYLGDKNALKEYLLQLYDIEQEKMQTELDNYLMLRDEELIVDAESFNQKVRFNEDYLALIQTCNAIFTKSGVDAYNIDGKNFESLIEAKTDLLNYFMEAMANANANVQKEAAELGIKDLITNFKVTKVSVPSLKLNTTKPSTSSTKKPSTSSTTKKEVEDLELKIDIFYKYNKAIKDVENSLSKLDKRLEYATGKERVSIMKEQIELYKKLHAEQEKLLTSQELEYARQVKTLAGEGFKIDANGTITNYVEKLKELEAWANKATYEEKEARIEKVNQIKSWVDDFVDLVDDMNDTKLDLEDLGGNLKNAQEQLKSYYDEILGKVTDVESQITDMLKKELEKRKQAQQEAFDKQIELINKAKDVYNKQNEQDDFEKEKAKKQNSLNELQQAINIAMRDSSLAGQKRLEDLKKQLEEEKEEYEKFLEDKNREDENAKFDQALEELEKEKEQADKDFDEKFDEKTIANLVSELLGNGFTSIDGEIVKLSELMAEHFEDSFGLIGEKLQSDFIDQLEEARKIAVSINDIFKEIGVNADLGRIDSSIVGASVSQISKSTAKAMNEGIITYLSRGIAGTQNTGSRNLSIGSLLNVAGSIDREVLPNVENMVNQAVSKMQELMKNNFRIGTGRI